MTCRTKINAVVANPGDQSWTKSKFVLVFGAYGETMLLAYANHLDGAFEACGEWIIDNAPGLLATDAVNEEYSAALGRGLSEEEAQESATVDTVSIDSGNHYLHSWEVEIVAENPSRERLTEIFNR